MKAAFLVSKIFWVAALLVIVISVLIQSQKPTVRFCDDLDNQRYEYCQR
jgi:hypothetical protein